MSEGERREAKRDAQSWEQKDRPGACSKRTYSNLLGKRSLCPLSLFLFALFFHRTWLSVYESDDAS